MAKETGTIDYAAVLQALPVATRQKLFQQLIDGRDTPQGPVAGIAEQYVSALVEWRSMAELLEARQAFIASEAFKKLSVKVQEEATDELSRIAYMLEVRRSGLDSVGNELKRLQTAVGEIEKAGTQA